MTTGSRLQHFKDFGDASDWRFVLGGNDMMGAFTFLAASLGLLVCFMFLNAKPKDSA